MRRVGILLVLLASAGCTIAKSPGDAASPPPRTIMAACCGASDSAAIEEQRRYESMAGAERPPEVAVVPYRTTSGVTVRDRMVVSDPTSWSKVWLNVVMSHSPTPPVPPANFDRETIVIVAMGQRSTGGYIISIDSAAVAGDTVTLVVTERSPGRTCGTTAALSSPVAIARIFRPRATIRFDERTAVTDCG